MNVSTKIAALCLMMSLSACSTPSYHRADIDAELATQMKSPLLSAYQPMDEAMQCVGDQLRNARVGPITLGMTVADTTGKTGVDLTMVVVRALDQFSKRASFVSVTTMGGGPRLPGELRPLSQEEKMREWFGQERLLTRPDLILEGGVSSVTSSYLNNQMGGSIGARDVDLGGNRTGSVDLATLNFALKNFRSGVIYPGATTAVRVFWQQGSSAIGGGAYVAAKLDGRSLNSGVRMDKSNGKSEPTYDAIYAGIGYAVMDLLANRYGLDLQACTTGAHALADPEELRNKYRRMSQEERVGWVQSRLAQLGYNPGSVDGVTGQQTLQALYRFQQDKGLPLTRDISVTLFVALAMAHPSGAY